MARSGRARTAGVILMVAEMVPRAGNFHYRRNIRLCAYADDANGSFYRMMIEE
jgi:nickel-dependent lactate racemase